MGKNTRGVRDGTGPYKDSFQSKSGNGVGRRRQGGDVCPKGNRESKRK